MMVLMILFFNEIFYFKLLQSDFNLVNYQFKFDIKEIVLLDFGVIWDVFDVILVQY